MKAGTLLVALVAAGACIAGIVWLAGGSGPLDVAPSKPATDPEALEIAETGPYPKAVTPEKSFDFDMMASGTDMSHTFLIKNEGEAELQYKLKGTNCSCTVSDMEPDKIYTLPVGEEAGITVKWTPPGPDPAFVKEAEIFTNDPENPIVRFKINGRVEELVTIYPQDGWTLTSLAPNKPETFMAEITSPILEEIKIESAQGSSKNIQTRVEAFSNSELRQRQLKSGQRVIVTFEPKDLKLGEISETVTLKTDIKGHSEISLPLKGQYMGSITAYPYLPEGEKADGRKWYQQFLRLDLGLFSAKQGREGWYTLSIADMPQGETFQVRDIQSSNEYVTATVEPKSSSRTRQSVLVTFHVKPGIRPGSYDDKDDIIEVVLKTNHPYAPEVKFQLQFQAL